MPAAIIRKRKNAFRRAIATSETVLKESDFVCVVLPLTEETHHLIGEKQFAMMKNPPFSLTQAVGRSLMKLRWWTRCATVRSRPPVWTFSKRAVAERLTVTVAAECGGAAAHWLGNPRDTLQYGGLRGG